MFAAGAAALLLLFIGILNAWDAVTYHVFSGKPPQEPDGAKTPAQASLERGTRR